MTAASEFTSSYFRRSVAHGNHVVSDIGLYVCVCERVCVRALLYH